MLLSVKKKKKKIGGIVIKVSTNLSWPKREKGERETEEEREKEKRNVHLNKSSNPEKKIEANVVFHCDLGQFF